MKTNHSINEYHQMAIKKGTFPLFLQTDNPPVYEEVRPGETAVESGCRKLLHLPNGAGSLGFTGSNIDFSAPIDLNFHKGKETHQFVLFGRSDVWQSCPDELEGIMDV